MDSSFQGNEDEERTVAALSNRRPRESPGPRCALLLLDASVSEVVILHDPLPDFEIALRRLIPDLSVRPRLLGTRAKLPRAEEIAHLLKQYFDEALIDPALGMKEVYFHKDLVCEPAHPSAIRWRVRSEWNSFFRRRIGEWVRKRKRTQPGDDPSCV